MYSKSDSWLDVVDKTIARSKALSPEFGPKSARRMAIQEASEVLGRSVVLIRRYRTAEHSLMSLLPLAPTVTREDLGRLAFSTAEFIGRMESLNEELAADWLLRAVEGKVKVLEVRAAYEELVAHLKDRNENEANDETEEASSDGAVDIQGAVAREHNRIVDFKDAASEAARLHFCDVMQAEELNVQIGDFGGVLEHGPTFGWQREEQERLGTYVSLPTYLFEYQDVLKARLGRIAFSAQYFSEFWILISEAVSTHDRLALVGLISDLESASIGIAMLSYEGRLVTLKTPDAAFEAKTLPG